MRESSGNTTAGAHQKLDKTLARVAELAAVFETAEAATAKAIATGKAAEQMQAEIADLRREVAALTVDLQGQRGVMRGWFAELDKSIKSASHALYPSRVEAWIGHVGVGVFAAIAVLVFQYLVSVARNLL